MGAALMRVDVVGKAEDRLAVGPGPLQCDGNLGVVGCILEVGDLTVNGLSIRVEVLHEVHEAARVLEDLLDRRIGSLVSESDLETLVEESHLAEATHHGLGGVFDTFAEDLRVGPEDDLRSRALRLGPLLDGSGRHSVFVGLRPVMPVADDVHVHACRQSVDHRNANPVKAAGDGVGAGLELAAGVEGRHHRGEGGLLRLGMLQYRNTSAVVSNTHSPVGKQRNFNPGAVAGHGFVHRVVDRLPDEVVQPTRTGRPDIHRGPSPDRLETLEDLDVLCFI